MAQTYTPAALQPGIALTTVSAPVYTVPSATIARVARAVFSNQTSSAVTYTVSITRAGQPALTFIKAKSIAAGANDTCPEMAALVLLGGDVLSAQASAAAAVNLVISGLTVT